MNKSKSGCHSFVKTEQKVNEISNYIINLIKRNKIQFVLLNGEIGSGKTTLVKQIANVFHENEIVVSPTFNKMIIYNDFIHIDAYNLKNDSLEMYLDYFNDKIVIIEWAENLMCDFDRFINVNIKFKTEFEREYWICWKV